MITINKYDNGTELNLNSANANYVSYGHYKIVVELEYKGVYKEFSKTITNMEVIDNAKEAGIDSWEDKAQILYDAIEYQISDLVEEWMCEVDCDIEN